MAAHCRKRDKLANLPEALIEYRWHGGNVTNRNAIRQAFSVRLAQRSAQARRQTGIDPAEGLNGPPDWRAQSADGIVLCGRRGALSPAGTGRSGVRTPAMPISLRSQRASPSSIMPSARSPLTP